MKIFSVFLASILLGNAGLCVAATTYNYQTTLTSMSIDLPDAQVPGSYPPPESTPKPRSIVITPSVPNYCLSFPLAYLFQLSDLTDEAQKQMYATLVTAKINGLTVTLSYQVESALMRCRIVGVSF